MVSKSKSKSRIQNAILLNRLSSNKAKLRNQKYFENEAILSWSSTGGGWRSMVACMGFANLFQQSSLLSPMQPSPFAAISTVSGSSWFSTQLFYSSDFYNATVLSTPDELYDFVTEWFDSYASLSKNATEYEACEELYEAGNGTVDNNTKALCNMAIQYKGDWAGFIEDMLNNAAIKAFNDEEFISKIMDSDGRLSPLKSTDLFIVTGLVPTSRGSFGTVYLGPDNSDELYTVMIPAAYVVQDTSVDFWYGVPSPPKAYSSNASSGNFSFSNWDKYNLFPQNGSATISNTMGAKEGLEKFFRDPFGGGATTVAGPAAASSALLGYYSGLVPSAYAQTMSVIEYETIATSPELNKAQKAIRKAAFEKAVGGLYNAELLYGFTVCSQWPNPCGSNDGHFLDGIATDTTSLSMIIGNYHNSPKADLTIPMKIILTNTNAKWDPRFDHQQILMHYSTDFNMNVAPGGFLWLPYYNKQPILSPQIFEEFMDGNMLEASLKTIPNSTMTTAILRGTTISNPAFSVKPGQSVEVLLINLNTDIPTIIAGADLIEELTDPMASMAKDIATNEELLNRVNTFVQVVSSSSACSYSFSNRILTTMVLCITTSIIIMSIFS